MAGTLIQIAYSTAGVGPGITRYCPLWGGGGNVVGTELNIQRVERSGGVYSGLYVRVTTNASDGSTSIRFRKNTANGNQVVTFAAAETGVKQDLVNTDSVAVTDVVNYQMINGGAVGNISFLGISTLFRATTNTVNHYGLNVVNLNISFGTTTYFGFGGDQSNTTLAQEEMKVGTVGTIKNMGVRLTNNTLDVTGTAVFRHLINGANGNVTISFAFGETGLKEDTANTDVVAVNDLVTVRLVTTGISGSINIVGAWISMETTNNKADYISACHSTRTAAQTRYFDFVGDLGAASTETSAQFVAQNGATFSNYRGYVSANTLTSNTEVRLRKNTANVNETITYATTVTGWLHDLVNTDVILSTDLLDHQIITSAGSGSITVENVVVTAEMAAEVSGGSTLLLMGVG